MFLHNHTPFTGNHPRSFVNTRRTELSAAQDLSDVVIFAHGSGNWRNPRTTKGVTIGGTQLPKENLHRLRGLKRKPRICAIFSKLSGQTAKQETAKRAPISRTFLVTLAVREAPRGEIVGSVIRSEVAIATCQGNGIAKNGTANGVSCEGKKMSPQRDQKIKNAPGQRPAPTTTGFASSACSPA
jgi:hypothetical protein